MFSFGLVFLLVAVTTVSSVADNILRYINEVAANQFEEFIETYDKNYNSELEKALRFGIFLKNLDELAYQNKVNHDAEFGITQFSDLINEEFIQYHTGYLQPVEDVEFSNVTHTRDLKVASQFDWREKGVVTKVKNQQIYCGSCWAFSVIGNVESVNAIKTRNLQELSEQQLVDCDKNSDGCRGGLTNTAFEYLKSKGSMSARAYPYMARDGKCKYNPGLVAVRLRDVVRVAVQESQLAQKLIEFGPLSIAIDSTVLKKYQNGIISGQNCRGGSLSHAVLLVGYGTDSATGKSYWLVKNSFGKYWGEEGYFRMERGTNCLNFMTGSILTAVI